MSGPRVLTGGVLVGAELAARVRRFCARVGYRHAPKRLGIGDGTLEAAREGGRMQPATRVRLVAALEREEALLATRVAS